MGQEPNIPLHIEDLPRATAHPGAARRWAPNRPGDLSGPEDVPAGGFATPGPDTGYVFRLLRGRDLPLGGSRRRSDVEAAVAAIAAARAASVGRAPVGKDVDFAVSLVADEPDDVINGIAHDHERLRELVVSHHGLISGQS